MDGVIRILEVDLMAKCRRTISCVIPKEEYFGAWLKGDFVNHCLHLFYEIDTVLDLGCGEQ